MDIDPIYLGIGSAGQSLENARKQNEVDSEFIERAIKVLYSQVVDSRIQRSIKALYDKPSGYYIRSGFDSRLLSIIDPVYLGI